MHKVKDLKESANASKVRSVDNVSKIKLVISITFLAIYGTVHVFKWQIQV